MKMNDEEFDEEEMSAIDWLDRTPDWNDMPEPIHAMSISWEDIWAMAKEEGMELTKEQVVKLMPLTAHYMAKSDNLYDAYWEVIRFTLAHKEKYQ